MTVCWCLDNFVSPTASGKRFTVNRNRVNEGANDVVGLPPPMSKLIMVRLKWSQSH